MKRNLFSTNGGVRVTYIHNACDVPFNGDTAQHQVDLVVTVAESAEVFDDAKAALAVGDGGVHVMLLAVLVDAEALEVDHPAGAELRLHGSWDVDGRFASDHPELGLSVLDHVELDRDHPGDFNRPAE